MKGAGAGTPQPRASLFFLLESSFLVNGHDLLLPVGHVEHKVHQPVGVAKFIVIPENDLDKMVAEGNASLSIKDRRLDVSVKIPGDVFATGHFEGRNAEGHICVFLVHLWVDLAVAFAVPVDEGSNNHNASIESFKLLF